jgi:hypothetical protein
MLAVALAVVGFVTGVDVRTATPRDGAMRISSHHEQVRDGAVTRTLEVEDVLTNDWGIVLEGRYTFRLPPGAALTGVSLDVNGSFVDGEVAPDRRANEILNDVESEFITRWRARDPAVVERLPDGTVSVKIFPIPEYGERRIRLTVVAPQTGAVTHAAIAAGREGFVLRMPFGAPQSADAPRAIVVDVSHSRSDAALEREVAAAQQIISNMPDGAPFVVMACDTACERLPESGVEKKSESSEANAGAWLRGKKRGRARDVVGALSEAARAIGGRGHITLVGSARATAGVLGRDAMAGAAARAVGSEIAFDGIAVDDDGGDLGFLQGTLARDVELPRGLRTTSRRIDGDMLVLAGSMSGYVGGGEAVTKDGAFALRSVPSEGSAADALFLQSRIDELEEKHDDRSLARAGEIGRAHRLLAQRASWIVLENEAMFAQYGIARTPGTKRALSAPPPPKEPPSPPGTHRVRVVSMRMMSAFVVSSRLPAETIQYSIHQQHRRFRACYEAGLRAFPTLTGRVAVKFVISRRGEVVVAQDGGSDIPDREVVSCMVGVMRELSFPPQESGTVTVVYPFMLTPEEGTSDERPLFQMRVAQSAPSAHDLWVMRLRADEHPEDMGLRTDLGRWLALAGDARGSARAYDELSDFVPARADVHAHAAIEYLRAHDLGRAAAHAASALELGGLDAFYSEFPEVR